MKLTPEQQAVLDGSKGAVMAKVMKTLVMYGDAFGAEKMVPVTSTYGHTVISFGINAMKPVYDLYDQLIEAGAFSEQKFTADPLPLDKNVPSNPLQDLVFRQFMYKQQARYEAQLKKLGILSDKDYTCTCYLDEVGNKPKQGEVLSWAESSAVVYANSVLGARCNRNSGMIELMGSIAGCVPYFGFLTDDGRKADWIVEVRTTKKPEPQLLGSAIGMKVMEKVPYVKGLDQWIGTEINEDAIAYLKDFGAATASNGAVGLYHIEHLTPEAVQQGEALIRDGAPVYVIDDAELQRVRESYPCVWKNLNAKPKLCFMGCPHMTLHQLIDTTERVEASLRAHGQRKVCIPTVFTAAPGVIEEFEKTEYAPRLRSTGVVLSYICPLMYMNNPLSKAMPVITSSNKLRTYKTARYYTEDEIITMITKGPTNMKQFQGRVICPGTCEAEALVSHGGFNTLASYQMALMFHDKQVKCGDQNNPDLYKKPMIGKALCLPETIGSTTGGMVLYTACASGQQPACMLFSKHIDSLAASGAILASVWTDADMPVIDCLGDEFLAAVQTGQTVRVLDGGVVEVA